MPDFATNAQARQQQKDDRPRLVWVDKSRNVLFEGVRFENSPSFRLMINDSNDISRT